MMGTKCRTLRWPLQDCSCLQAVPSKHDVGVPAPFQQGQASESSLGVSIQPPTGFDTAQTGVEQYANIAQVCVAATTYTHTAL